ncbi:hypothetical protein SUGI_1013130 [Cryptomeria japonica]|nr:hypothetical protein SUGI_1013130 [Cryptomeria japonica]
MSERWSLDNPTEIRVTSSHNFDDYLKCIEFMYHEQVYFCNVEECPTILSVASELLADECINKCMQYLEVVRWSGEQESQIRHVLFNLASRLVKEDGDHIIFLERIFNQMVVVLKYQYSTKINWETAEKHITSIFEGNRCRDVVEVCGRVLLQEFKSSICSRDLLSMSSLVFQFIEHCDGETVKEAFVSFVKI